MNRKYLRIALFNLPPPRTKYELNAIRWFLFGILSPFVETAVSLDQKVARRSLLNLRQIWNIAAALIICWSLGGCSNFAQQSAEKCMLLQSENHQRRWGNSNSIKLDNLTACVAIKQQSEHSVFKITLPPSFGAPVSAQRATVEMVLTNPDGSSLEIHLGASTNAENVFESVPGLKFSDSSTAALTVTTDSAIYAWTFSISDLPRLNSASKNAAR